MANAEYMINELTAQIAQLSKERAAYAAIALEKELENRQLREELEQVEQDNENNEDKEKTQEKSTEDHDKSKPAKSTK